jgi:hypothetical protein
LAIGAPATTALALAGETAAPFVAAAAGEIGTTEDPDPDPEEPPPHPAKRLTAPTANIKAPTRIRTVTPPFKPDPFMPAKASWSA